MHVAHSTPPETFEKSLSAPHLKGRFLLHEAIRRKPRGQLCNVQGIAGMFNGMPFTWVWMISLWKGLSCYIQGLFWCLVGSNEGVKWLCRYFWHLLASVVSCAWINLVASVWLCNVFGSGPVTYSPSLSRWNTFCWWVKIERWQGLRSVSTFFRTSL